MQYELNFIVINYCLHLHWIYTCGWRRFEFRSTNARFH